MGLSPTQALMHYDIIMILSMYTNGFFSVFFFSLLQNHLTFRLRVDIRVALLFRIAGVIAIQRIGARIIEPKSTENAQVLHTTYLLE